MLTKINNFKVHNVVLNILILISWYTLFLNNGKETGLCNNLHTLLPDCDSYHICVDYLHAYSSRNVYIYKLTLVIWLATYLNKRVMIALKRMNSYMTYTILNVYM